VPNEMKFRIDENIKVKFTNTGHMLGSGVANIEITENGKIKRIAYTGDIGRPVDRFSPIHNLFHRQISLSPNQPMVTDCIRTQKRL